MKKLVFIGALFLVPALALGAGFAKQSLFLSQSPVTEGDSVRIYAVVSNNASTKFTGTVVVTDGKSALGAPAVTLEAGGTQTVSVRWQPSAGSHTVTAALTATGGTTVEQESATFTVEARPQPNATVSAAAVESSQQIQNQIGSFSSTAATWSAPAFTVIDGLRDKTAQLLDDQIANAKTHISSKNGAVEGASTSVPDPQSSFFTIFYTVYLYVLTIVRWLIGNAGVFYPVLALAFLYLLWRIFRRMRRPSY